MEIYGRLLLSCKTLQENTSIKVIIWVFKFCVCKKHHLCNRKIPCLRVTKYFLRNIWYGYFFQYYFRTWIYFLLVVYVKQNDMSRTERTYLRELIVTFQPFVMTLFRWLDSDRTHECTLWLKTQSSSSQHPLSHSSPFMARLRFRLMFLSTGLPYHTCVPHHSRGTVVSEPCWSCLHLFRP